MRRILTAGAATLAAAVLLPATLAAQSMPCNFGAPPEELAQRASPADSVQIDTDAGMIKVCYSQPSARDREIMGGLVPYGQPWRLGANEPSLIHVGFPARIGDVEVDAGAYGLYAVPGEDEWMIAVNTNTERWGIPIDESVMKADVGRTAVSPGQTDEHVEQLTYSLQAADAGGADLVIEWERTRVTVPIRPRSQ